MEDQLMNHKVLDLGIWLLCEWHAYAIFMV
jgi:hypothetical protein